MAREHSQLSKKSSLKNRRGLRKVTLKSTNSTTHCIARKKLRGVKHGKLSGEECARYVKSSMKRKGKNRKQDKRSLIKRIESNAKSRKG